MVDLTILGGGAAGNRAALLAAKAGMSVTLIECGAAGGGAVHEGYWQYKRMLADAADLMRGREGFLGLKLLTESHIHGAIIKRAHEQSEKLSVVQEKSLKDMDVEVINGVARVDGLRNRRYLVSTDHSRHETRRLLIAAGSVPLIPDIADIERYIQSGFIITPKEILFAQLPHTVVVAGGNIRALQIAAWFASHRVHVILTSPTTSFAEELDSEVALWLKRTLKGIEYLERSEVSVINDRRVTIITADGGRSVECDKVVIGARRRPATRGIGLGTIGIAIENGAIITDLTCHTNLPDVYAAGDVNMRTLTAAGAFCEAEVCISNMLGHRASVSYRSLPKIFTCGAEGASVGETDENARAMGYNTICVKVDILEREEEGFIKLVVDEKNKLLGAHLCGWGGSEVIWQLAAMIEKDIDLGLAHRMLRPDSAMADAVQQALLKL